MDKKSLVRRLQSDFGYPEGGAKIVAAKVQAFAEPISEAFDVWWNEGRIPDLEVEGYTPQRLMDEHGFEPIAAFLTLDWLHREPGRALASLERGHDRVQFRSR